MALAVPLSRFTSRVGGSLAIYVRQHYTPQIMNIRIDIKSALVGLGAGVLIALVVAASPSGSSVGRYRLTSVAPHENTSTCYVFVIDTMTGKVWRGSTDSRTDDACFAPKDGEK